jgi:hypothetical protein
MNRLRMFTEVTPASAAQDGSNPLGCAFHRSIAGRTGVVFGQRPIGCPEPQRKGKRLAVLADLRTDKNVKQLDVLQ